jgi:hypothetical protein
MANKKRDKRLRDLRKRRKKIEANKPWVPFVKCDTYTREEAEEIVRREICSTPNQEYSEEVVEHAIDQMICCEYYKNNKYQVAVYPPETNAHLADASWPAVIHLSIKSIDKSPVHDWSDLQRIKNEIIGNENEAIEIYPAESRLVNMANQYHLWVFKDPNVRIPIGFNEGRKVDVQREGSKAKQRLVDTRS